MGLMLSQLLSDRNLTFSETTRRFHVPFVQLELRATIVGGPFTVIPFSCTLLIAASDCILRAPDTVPTTDKLFPDRLVNPVWLLGNARSEKDLCGRTERGAEDTLPFKIVIMTE
jgi:hypothetical protein